MKNLKQVMVLLSLVFTLISTQNVYGQEDAGAASEVAQEVQETVAEGTQTRNDEVRRTAEDQAAALITTAYGVNNPGELQNRMAAINENLSTLNSIDTSTIEGSAHFMREAGGAASEYCVKFGDRAVTCCGAPESCSASSLPKLANTANIITKYSPLLALLGLGDSALLSCIQAVPAATSLLGQFTGIGNACSALKSGDQLSYNNQPFQVLGVESICDKIYEVVRDKPLDVAYSGSKQDMLREIRSVREQVSEALTGTVQSASAGAEQTQSSVDGLAGCIANIAGTDGSESSGPSCPANSSYSSTQRACIDGAGQVVANNEDGGSFKAGTFSDDAGGVAEEDTDEGVFPEDTAFAGAPDSGGGQAAQGRTARAGGGASGGGSGSSASAKAGKRRGSSKGRSLIAGYKSSKGGGGGGSYSSKRKPASFRGLSKLKKTVLKTGDKEALAALTKLVQAGVSPDQSGSIFERVSRKFSTSASKQNLFDAKRNKTLWMEK